MKALLGTPALLVAARLGGALAGMIFLMLLTQSGGAALAGTVSALIATAMLLGLAGTLNIEAGAVRFMVQALDQGQPGTAVGFIRFSRRYAAAISLTLCAGVWVLTPDPSPAFTLALAAAPLIAWTRLNAGVAIGFSRVAAGVIPRTFLRQLFLLTGTAAFLALNGTPTPAVILAVYLAANLAVALCQTALLRPSERALKTPADQTDAPKWVRLGLTLGLNVLYLEYAIHLIIFTAAFVLAPADLARLDVALKLAAFLKFANTAINQAFMPRFSAAMGRGDAQALTRWLALSNLLKLGANLTGLAALAIIAPHLLPLFGPEFTGLAPLVLLLALEPLIATLFGPGANIVSLSKRPARLLPILAATLALLVGGTLLGGHLAGLPGIAAAFLAAATLWSASLAIIARTRLATDTTLPASLRWALAATPKGRTA
ncbi:MAG: hypothetical protein AAFY59_09815 [Pseudomonadota bacterium]